MMRGGIETDPETMPRPSFVILSGYHDYRSRRKADLHFIADELKARGKVDFISLRYSYLTRYKVDPRHDLWDRANRTEIVDGVGCYLWRTPIHPFHLPRRFALVETAMFAAFARHLPPAVREVIAGAGVVLIESGISIIYIPLIRRLNPAARIVYLASDSLDAIGQAGAIKDALKAHAAAIDAARVPSPFLARDVPPQVPCYYIPHGIDKSRFEAIGPPPFAPGSVNAVSVGSMLFDPAFFVTAGRAFPNVTFHVIGSGHEGEQTADVRPANVRYYGEMPFEQTLPYLKHSAFAVAPYGAGVEPYLMHTSMKLMQYNYLGVPAVCPRVVAGAGNGRFGYDQDRPPTIVAAIEAALRSRGVVAQPRLDWGEVTELIVAIARADGVMAAAAAGPDSESPIAGSLIRHEYNPA